MKLRKLFLCAVISALVLQTATADRAWGRDFMMTATGSDGIISTMELLNSDDVIQFDIKSDSENLTVALNGTDPDASFGGQYELKISYSIDISDTPTFETVTIGTAAAGTTITKTTKGLDMGKAVLSNLADGTLETDAATVGQMESKENQVRSDFAAADNAVRNEFAAADNAVRNEFAAADNTVRNEFAAADNIVRNEFAAADNTVRDEFAAADNTVRDDFAAADNTVRDEFAAADNTVRNEFAAADNTVRDEFAAADDTVRSEFAAADNTVRSEFAAADNTVRDEFAAADNTVRSEFAAADDTVRSEFADADNIVRSEFQAADSVLSGRLDGHDSDIQTLQNVLGADYSNANFSTLRVGNIYSDGRNINMGGGRITGLADGGVYQGSTDAVTGNQLWESYQRMGTLENYVYRRMDDLQESINIVGAHAAALSGLHPIDYNPYEPTTLSAAIGTYRDEYAVAVGVFHYVRESVLFNLGASICSDGDLMGRAGVSFTIGKSGKKQPLPPKDMNEVQAQLAQVQQALLELKAENEALKARLDAKD